MTRTVDTALLGNDLRSRTVYVLADDVRTLINQRGRSGAFLDRVVPGAGAARSLTGSFQAPV